MTRFDDVTPQRDRASEAKEKLAEALLELAAEAKVAAKAAQRDQLCPVDLDAVYAADRRVRRAEEDLDLSLLDFHTARGEDV